MTIKTLFAEGGMTLEVIWTRENGGDWKFKTFQMDIINTQGQDSHVKSNPAISKSQGKGEKVRNSGASK